MIASGKHAAGDLTPYEFFMLCLCLWALIMLGADSFFHLSDSTRAILTYADYFVCLIFFLDFIYSFHTAPKKWQYLTTWGWIDLLSSVPVAGSLRWGRAVRIMRILRVMRGVKSARAIAHFLTARRSESTLLASILLALLLMVVCSIAMLEFEVPIKGNIATGADALWWAVSTMTTVGYGDTYPLSPEGRVVAVFLMAAGVGVFGTFSGLIAAWFLSPSTQEADSDLAEIKAMLLDLQKEVARLRAGTPI